MKDVKSLNDNIYLQILGQTPVKKWCILNNGHHDLRLDIVPKLSKKFLSYVKDVKDIIAIYIIARKSSRDWLTFDLGMNYTCDGDKKYKIIFYKISKKEND